MAQAKTDFRPRITSLNTWPPAVFPPQSMPLHLGFSDKFGITIVPASRTRRVKEISWAPPASRNRGRPMGDKQ